MPPKKRKPSGIDFDPHPPANLNDRLTTEQNLNDTGTSTGKFISYEIFLAITSSYNTCLPCLTLLFILASGTSAIDPNQSLGGTAEMIMQLQIDGMSFFPIRRLEVIQFRPVEILRITHTNPTFFFFFQRILV